MGVNKAWCLHFGMGEMCNEIRLALSELGIHDSFTFIEARGMIYEKTICKYFCNWFIFNITQSIVIPIEWHVQHARLSDLGFMQLQYL
jgi:hypothetical protein